MTQNVAFLHSLHNILPWRITRSGAGSITTRSDLYSQPSIVTKAIRHGYRLAEIKHCIHQRGPFAADLELLHLFIDHSFGYCCQGDARNGHFNTFHGVHVARCAVYSVSSFYDATVWKVFIPHRTD